MNAYIMHDVAHKFVYVAKVNWFINLEKWNMPINSHYCINK